MPIILESFINLLTFLLKTHSSTVEKVDTIYINQKN